MKKIKYEYAIIRYVHDVISQEFINIGVIVYIPNENIQFNKLTNRLKNFFPDIQEKSFLNLVEDLHKCLKKFNIKKLNNAIFGDSFQLSNWGGGLTDNCQNQLNLLYERYVKE